MAKIRVVMLSKDDKFMMDEQYFPETETCKVVRIANNREKITSVYNRQLEIGKNEGCDIVVLMHADVKFDVPHFLSHLEECKDKYDVIGLCGCAKISVSQKPLNWFCGSRPYPESRWGCVTHGELNNQTSYFSKHSPNIMDHSVSCIDGLCIIFCKNALNSDLRFDERIGWNCYDTMISFETVMVKKMRLGVMVETSLQHYSVGRGILEDSFYVDEKILRERYQLQV